MMRVGHFEIHAENPEAAIAFYKGLFGWEFSKWEGGEYWLITTGPEGTPGINGGLLPRRGPAPVDGQGVNAYACTITVPNLDEMLSKIEPAGGRICLAKMPIPGVGWLGYAIDNQGNIFGMMQPDPQAKCDA